MLQRLEQPMEQSHKQKTQADQADHSSHSALQNHSTLAQDPPGPQATPTHNRAGLTRVRWPGLGAQLREIWEQHRRFTGRRCRRLARRISTARGQWAGASQQLTGQGACGNPYAKALSSWVKTLHDQPLRWKNQRQCSWPMAGGQGSRIVMTLRGDNVKQLRFRSTHQDQRLVRRPALHTPDLISRSGHCSKPWHRVGWDDCDLAQLQLLRQSNCIQHLSHRHQDLGSHPQAHDAPGQNA